MSAIHPISRLQTAGALAAVLCAVSLPAVPAWGAPAPVPAPPAAAAGAKPPVTASQQAQARLHFQQGVALYQDQNYDAALAEFLGAYAISAEPIVLYNLGLTYKTLFRYPEAIDTLERYLAESTAKGHPVSKERRAEVETIVAGMKSLLAEVTLFVTPPDAAVRIDGRSVTLNIEGIVKLAAGNHTIEASSADYKPGRSEITVVAGTPQKVSMALVAIPRTGRLRIGATQIGARVSVDGNDAGPAPVDVELLAGGHQVTVTAPGGYAPYRGELVIAAGQAREVSITLEMPPAPLTDNRPLYKRWWFWTGIGVAAAAGGTLLLIPTPTQGPLEGTLGLANSNKP